MPSAQQELVVAATWLSNRQRWPTPKHQWPGSSINSPFPFEKFAMGQKRSTDLKKTSQPWPNDLKKTSQPWPNDLKKTIQPWPNDLKKTIQPDPPEPTSKLHYLHPRKWWLSDFKKTKTTRAFYCYANSIHPILHSRLQLKWTHSHITLHCWFVILTQESYKI